MKCSIPTIIDPVKLQQRCQEGPDEPSAAVTECAQGSMFHQVAVKGRGVMSHQNLALKCYSVIVEQFRGLLGPGEMQRNTINKNRWSHDAQIGIQLHYT